MGLFGQWGLLSAEDVHAMCRFIEVMVARAVPRMDS